MSCVGDCVAPAAAAGPRDGLGGVRVPLQRGQHGHRHRAHHQE